MSVNWTVELARDDSRLQGPSDRDFNYCHNVFAPLVTVMLKERLFRSEPNFSTTKRKNMPGRDS